MFTRSFPCYASVTSWESTELVQLLRAKLSFLGSRSEEPKTWTGQNLPEIAEFGFAIKNLVHRDTFLLEIFVVFLFLLFSIQSEKMSNQFSINFSNS